MNRKVKAIIEAAVAMGYGTEADYSGGSVGDTLEEFAEIAAQGGGGSAPFVVTFSGTTDGGDAACDKTWDEIYANRDKRICVYYDDWELLPRLTTGILTCQRTYVEFEGLDIGSYVSMQCSINSINEVFCAIQEA